MAKSNFIIFESLNAQLYYLMVAEVEALCFMVYIQYFEFIVAILAGCAIRVVRRLEAGLGIPPWGDGGGTDVKLNYHLNSTPY